MAASITFAEWTGAIGVSAEDMNRPENEGLKGRLRAKYDEAMAQLKAAEEEDEDKEDEDEEVEGKSAKAGDKPPWLKEKIDDDKKDAKAQEDEEDEEGKAAKAQEDEEKKKEEEKVAAQESNREVIRATFDEAKDWFEDLWAQHEDTLKAEELKPIRAEARGDLVSLKQEALKSHWGSELFKAKAEIIHAEARLKIHEKELPKGPTIVTTQKKTELTDDILACAVMQAGKYERSQLEYDPIHGRDKKTVVEKIDDIYSDETCQRAHDRFHGRLGLQQFLIEAASANGWVGNPFQPNYSEVLQYAMPPAYLAPAIHAASQFSTVDVSGILSNVANKFLLEGFTFVEQSWREICAVRPVNDFKTVTSYRMTMGGGFEKVPPTGEIKHGTLGEESYTNKADTYGVLLGVSRTDIINDDLGAITRVPREIGKKGGLGLNKQFWTTFLGAISTLFVNDHGTPDNDNYQSGAATALGITSLTSAEALFMDLKDNESDPIGHMPTILLCPTALSTTAAQLFKDTDLRGYGAANTVYTTGNPHQGKFRPVVSRYIGNATYTGYTTTGWGIFADPKDVAVIEAAFLFGNESPTIEQSDADFNTLGIQMRGYFDYGFATQDYRGGVWSAGA